MKTLEQWRMLAEACVVLINQENYYPHIWERIKHEKPLDQCTKEELLQPFQAMWELLPDSPSIRRYPFFLICDLAEEYCFPEDCSPP